LDGCFSNNLFVGYLVVDGIVMVEVGQTFGISLIKEFNDFLDYFFWANVAFSLQL